LPNKEIMLYVRVAEKPIRKGKRGCPIVVEKDNTDTDVAAHKGIVDIKIGESGAIAEDTTPQKPPETAKSEDGGLILPGAEIDLGDDGSIKPGESVEL